MKKEEWVPRAYTPKETKMLVSGRYMRNAIIWINRVLRRKQISDEERKVIEDIRDSMIRIKDNITAYCDKYIDHFDS